MQYLVIARVSASERVRPNTVTRNGKTCIFRLALALLCLALPCLALPCLSLPLLSSPWLVKYSTHFNKKCRGDASLRVRFPFINIRKRPKLCQSAAETAATTTAATPTNSKQVRATTAKTSLERIGRSRALITVRLFAISHPPLSLFVGCV